MKRIILGCILSCIIPSCLQVNHNDGIMTELSAPIDDFTVSSISDSVYSFVLQLPDPYFWGVVTDAYFKDSVIFVVDKLQGNIFRFKKDGTFLNKIGQKGGGPNEFSHLTDCFVDNEMVYVGDINTRELYCYTHDGEYVKTISFSFELIYDDIVPLSDGRFLCHDIAGYKDGGKIWIMGANGDMEKALLCHDAVYPFSSTPWSTIGYTEKEGVFLILDPISGTIYSYDSYADRLDKICRLVSDFKGLNSFAGSDLLLAIEDEYGYPVFSVASGDDVFSIWNTSESLALYSFTSILTGNSKAYTRMIMDMGGHTCVSLPITTNLPNKIVMAFTDEFLRDCNFQYDNNNMTENALLIQVFSLNFDTFKLADCIK